MDNSLAAGREPVLSMLKKLIQLKPLGGRFDDTLFEAAVSLTASIATSLSENDFVVDIFAAGSEIHHFRTGPQPYDAGSVSGPSCFVETDDGNQVVSAGSHRGRSMESLPPAQST